MCVCACECVCVHSGAHISALRLEEEGRRYLLLVSLYIPRNVLGLAVTSRTGLLALWGRQASTKETWVWGWQPGPQLPEECCPWKELASHLSLLPASELLSRAPPPTQPGPCLEGPSAPGLRASMSLPGHLLVHSLAPALSWPAVYWAATACRARAGRHFSGPGSRDL